MSWKKPKSTDRHQAGKLSQRAMELVKHFKLVPSPQNYELFFRYASGDQEQLPRTIDEKLRNGGSFSASELKSLHKRWVGNSAKREDLSLLGGRLGDEVRDVLALVKEASTSTSDFNDSLSDIETSLGDFSDPHQVKEAMAALVRATRQVSEDSLRLKQNLATSTDHIESLQKDLEFFQEESLTDALTGIANRKFFDQDLEMAISEARQSGKPLCLSMVDVDHFKRFNDNFGHQTGDSVLRLASSVLKSGIRERDLAARYGGEEFALILRNTDLGAATAVSDALRTKLSTRELIRKLTSESLGHVSASFGVEQYRPGDTPESLIARADRNLYKAKRAGRNRVEPTPASDLKKIEDPGYAA